MEKDRIIPPIDPSELSSIAPSAKNLIEEKTGAIKAISRVTAAVSSRMDLESTLQICLDSVLNIMDGAGGGIMLLDPQTQTLSYHVHHNLSTAFTEGIRLKLGEGIAGKVAQSGKPVLVEDVLTLPDTARPDLVSKEGIRALLSIPLRARDNVVGVMNITSDLPRRFTERDKHFLYAIGDLIGAGIMLTKLYEQLSLSRERYRQLAQQMIIEQEDARRRLARELHDETSQSLSGLALQLQALIDKSKMSGTYDVEFMTRLEKVHSMTVQIHTEVSRLIANLHPPLLDTLGLFPAIKQHAESTLRQVEIKVSVEAKGKIRPLPPEMELELYRFSQGAVANIAQHSKAKNASIVLEYQEDKLLLEISDDGQGFDMSQIKHIEESGRGRGIFSMRERIKILGGTLSGQSLAGQGTTIWVEVPIS